jgi:flagellar hook protein FlgE
VAIQGDGFLRLGGGTPPTTAPYTATFNTITYTRAGNLTLNPQGFLMTPDGQYVIGRNVATGGGAGTSDSYINVPPSSSTVTVGQDGSVNYIDSSGNRQIAGYISLAKFPDQAGLARAGGTQWTPTANSGTEQVGTPNGAGYGQTIAGVLESSNVDLATEFTNMITAERGFQANSRVITTADEMLQTVVQMKQ